MGQAIINEKAFPRLDDEQIARVKEFGRIERLRQGTVLFERGDRELDFFVILDGNIEIYEHFYGGTRVITVHGKHNLTGELDLFNDREILVGRRHARSIKRVASAVGEGAMTISHVHRHLSETPA